MNPGPKTAPWLCPHCVHMNRYDMRYRDAVRLEGTPFLYESVFCIHCARPVLLKLSAVTSYVAKVIG